MASRRRIRPLLTRGSLLLAANWPVVALQFGADTCLTMLVAVPVAAGALALGAGDPARWLEADLRVLGTMLADALATSPVAAGVFTAALAVCLLAGSALVFLVKGGTVAVLAQAERVAGPIERSPLRMAALRRAALFSADAFLAGVRRLSRRYLLLGSLLLAFYAFTGAIYLGVVAAFHGAPGSPGASQWAATGAATGGFLGVVLVVNLGYLLTQIVIAVDDCGVLAGMRGAGRFARRQWPAIAGVFGVVLVLVAVATVLSVVVAAGLGMIGFVPVVGVVALPLQVAAWLVRGLLLQYLGLAALGAYLAQYGSRDGDRAFDGGRPAPSARVEPFPEDRTA